MVRSDRFEHVAAHREELADQNPAELLKVPLSDGGLRRLIVIEKRVEAGIRLPPRAVECRDCAVTPLQKPSEFLFARLTGGSFNHHLRPSRWAAVVEFIGHEIADAHRITDRPSPVVQIRFETCRECGIESVAKPVILP